MNSDYFSIIAFILFVTVVNEQCIFAKYLFYDIINNQYYEYHCSYRNYTAFTNRIVKIIKKSKFITVAFSVLYYYTIYIVDANNVVLDALGIEKSCQIAAKI
jgi:hypothetical protein